VTPDFYKVVGWNSKYGITTIHHTTIILKSGALCSGRILPSLSLNYYCILPHDYHCQQYSCMHTTTKCTPTKRRGEWWHSMLLNDSEDDEEECRRQTTQRIIAATAMAAAASFFIVRDNQGKRSPMYTRDRVEWNQHMTQLLGDRVSAEVSTFDTAPQRRRDRYNPTIIS
jgi:hypothetical protein